ncbi:hypothetical protein JOB18_042460 [Solea senegalensis]|uniref:Uncharacterized protein n=1 Tax=Solea senegalensis TaxID=28829 RepID=A0AAV6QH12_SOLSE|nr:hypothetical protein JOB18_042460 [Solea senegalensis]
MKLVNVPAIILSSSAHVAFRVQPLHIQKGELHNNNPNPHTSLDSMSAICPGYRWLGCCQSSYSVSFMLDTWQADNESAAFVFRAQFVQGFARGGGEKGQRNINSTQFPQDLESVGRALSHLCGRTLTNSSQSSPGRAQVLLNSFEGALRTTYFERSGRSVGKS